MNKYCNPAAEDALLNYISSKASRIVVLSADPAGVYSAVAAATLAAGNITSAAFTVGNGTPNGQQNTIAQQSNLSITTSGTAIGIAIVDDTDQLILLATTCTSQALTSGGTVTIPSFTHAVNDPT